MARKSRRNNNIIEKKQEMMTPEIITGPQLETGVYARLSVEKDNEETIQTQIEMLHQYVEEHGEYHLVDTYVDNGYTGTDFDRPGFLRMMEDVRTGKIQCIIVKDLSRFGRNFIETGYYIETIFPCLNVRLISINDEFDSSREEDRNSIVMPVKNMINEMYAKDASKKRVLAFEMQSKRGDATIARSIYGYTVDKKENQLKVNPETAPIVRAIFRWYQMGRGTGAIVKRLKMLDIMTPHAYKATHELDMAIPDTDRWTGDRVKTILVNQAYIGTTIYGKRKRAKYRNMPEHHTDPKDWVIHENTHESIIARPDFDEVQRIWNRASEKYKESVERGLARQMDIVDSFPQKVKCMECGMTMTYMRYTNFGQSHGIRKGFYYCKEYDGKPGYCRQKVHEDLLKITVMDQIHNMIQAMCDRKVLLEKMKEQNCLVDAYLRNREGVLVSRDKDSVPYTAQIWFEGRECDTRSENDILKSIRTLAQIHKIMQLPVEMDYAGRNLQEEYIRHNQEMKKIRRFIRKKGAVNSFEKDYLKSVEWFLQKGEEAAAMLETTDYKNLRQQSLQSGSICHGEYNQHNVLILGKNTAVTNFSHWSFDVQMADLYRFMRKILEKYSWDLHLAQKMLSAYDSVRPLSESEWQNLRVRFCYPEKYWKLANHYYTHNKAVISGKNVEKLRTLIHQKKQWEEFSKQCFR